MNFENRIIKGIYASQYGASWVKAGGRFGDYCVINGELYSDVQIFRRWLETLTINGEKLSEKDTNTIINVAECGKLELEESAEKFIKEL